MQLLRPNAAQLPREKAVIEKAAVEKAAAASSTGSQVTAGGSGERVQSPAQPQALLRLQSKTQTSGAAVDQRVVSKQQQLQLRLDIRHQSPTAREGLDSSIGVDADVVEQRRPLQPQSQRQLQAQPPEPPLQLSEVRT